MTAPRWISEALDASWHGRDEDATVDADKLAAELLERLPIAAMINVAATAAGVDNSIPLDLRLHAVRRIITAAIPALTSDPDVITLGELYQSACRALDHAGVPYGLGGDGVMKMLNIAERITWLSQQRPLRLDLERVEAERDAARKEIDRMPAQLANAYVRVQEAMGRGEAWVKNLLKQTEEAEQEAAKVRVDLGEQIVKLGLAEARAEAAEHRAKKHADRVLELEHRLHLIDQGVDPDSCGPSEQGEWWP